MQDRPHAGNRQVGLDVAMLVPHERCDAITWPDAQACESPGQTLSSFNRACQGLDMAFSTLPCDDLSVCTLLSTSKNDVSQDQG